MLQHMGRFIGGRPFSMAGLPWDPQLIDTYQKDHFITPEFRMAERQDPLYMWPQDGPMDNGQPSSTHSPEVTSPHQSSNSLSRSTSLPAPHSPIFSRPPGMNPLRPGDAGLQPPQAHVHHPGNEAYLSYLKGASGSIGSIAPNMPVSSASAPTSPLVVPQPLKVNKPPKTYHCRMCDQIFDSKSDLLVHSQHIHKQDPKPYKCPTCNKCFANSSYLSQHNRIHAGIKPYKCTICERKFTQLCHLQQHLRTHTGEKPYKCQHSGCGKAFTQLSNLQSHSRSHMTDKPYRCNSCYKCYADEIGLREHIPKHHETKHLKTHICRICGKSYTQETYLTRHMAKHSYDGHGRHGSMSKVPTSPSSLGSPQESPDIKPGLDGSLPTSPDSTKPSSAFMPLSHQFTAPNLINSSVPSNFFPSRLPNNTMNSPISHLSPPMSSPRFFSFDHMPFQKRGGECVNTSRDSMIANSLLSLQQIKNYTTTHPVFAKSEPNSPSHKEFS